MTRPAPTPSPSWPGPSSTVAELEEVGDALLGHFVDQCRRSGRSWSEISTALGVTKQAAHKRFSAVAPQFERFTVRAQAVLRHAADAARALRQGEVGTEHLLLALFDQPEGLAAVVLGEAGISRADCERIIRAKAATRPPSATGELPFSAGAVEALRRTTEEALRLGHNYIGTEHVLLSLMRADDDLAAETLAGLGATYDDLRARFVEKLARLAQR